MKIHYDFQNKRHIFRAGTILIGTRDNRLFFLIKDVAVKLAPGEYAYIEISKEQCINFHNSKFYFNGYTNTLIFEEWDFDVFAEVE
jgi:hypothetical protein